MCIVMAGIDHKTAEIAQREPFSFTADQAGELAAQLRRECGADGCVLLSTCNRTEIYLSISHSILPHPGQLLCNRLGLSQYTPHFALREGRAAQRHLMMVAAGLRSLVRGEDQILAQVKTAIDMAREYGATDPVLETLFRTAISAAKKARTLAPLAPVERSTAHRALEVLMQHTNLSGKQALVIGNGEMGKLMAELLCSAGCGVTMTLRSYKRGAAAIPAGCSCIPYEERYTVLPSCDILVSATASPHFTVRRQELLNYKKIPPYMVDLAVPRDIEPEAAALAGKGCWNVDNLGGNKPSQESAKKLMVIKTILDEYTVRYEKWHSYRSKLHAETVG